MRKFGVRSRNEPPISLAALAPTLLNLFAALWDSYTAFSNGHRLTSGRHTVQLVRVATCTFVLWLFCGPSADASFLGPQESRSKRAVCDQRTPSSNGPLRASFLRAKRRLAGRLFPARHIVHKVHPARVQAYRPRLPRDNDTAAVQTSGAAAVGGEASQCFLALLEPLGILTLPQSQRLDDLTIARSSPRGPPPFTQLT
jgi:hypothetical protein